MRLTTVQSISNLKDAQELSRYLAPFVEDVTRILNGNVSLLDNVKGFLVDVVFSTVGTVQVRHTLKTIPSGYIVVKRSADVQVFDGSSENTDQFLYVQASAPGTVRLYVF